MLSYEVKGLDTVMARVSRVDKAMVSGVRGIISEHTVIEAARFRKMKYPPRLPNQRYIRTGRLGRSFGSRQSGRSVFEVYNNTPYSRWVIWLGWQAPIHAGRWWTFQKRAQSHVKRLVARLKKYIDKRAK